MNTTTLPQVTFSKQSVVANFPDELHEAIVVTPELIEFAKAALPLVKEQRDAAKGRERLALSASRGEGAWRRNEGPSKSRQADRLVTVVAFLQLLASGRNATSWDGWVDRAEWASIVEAIQ